MVSEVPHTIAIPELIRGKLSDRIIYEGKFFITSGENLLELEGQISYLITPKPNVCFNGRVLKGNSSNILKDTCWKLNTPTNIKGDFYLTSIKPSYREGVSELRIEGSLQYELTISTCSQFKEIKFSLLNFIDNYGKAYKYEDYLNIGRTELKYKSYLIIFDKAPNNKSTFSDLKEQGGYGITHIGQIKRIDSKEFELNEIEKLLGNLAWIFSFVAGRRVDINHIYTDCEEFSLICYRLPSITSWKSIANWYPVNSREALDEVLRCLLKLMEDDYWEKQLPRLLSQYFDGFGPSYIENRIIVIQAGLETLAWAYLVETRGILSKNKYTGPAASKIEKLLNELNIDSGYIEMPVFKGMSYSFEHGPHLFTDIRNAIVHPERKKKELSPDQLYYVWRMGMYYFELGVLAISGYKGEYSNMMLDVEFQSKRIQKVPWFKEDERLS